MLYELITKGDNPFDKKEAKDYLRVDHSDDDSVISMQSFAVIQYAENMTGRDFRANTWKLFLDSFEDRICLQRSPVASITSVQNTIAGTLTTVPTSVYYLKKGYQWSELLLLDGQEWPTTGDDVLTTNEHTIEVVFKTGIVAFIDEIETAMLSQLAYLYSNRGDCTAKEASKESGAEEVYDHFRIDRI